MNIRNVRAADAAAVAEIYNYYIVNTAATFEEVELGAGEMAERIDAVAKQNLPWLVAEEGDRVVGYSYASRWRERSAYRHSVEVTVYLAHDCTGAGYGTRLYRRLFQLLAERSVHVAIGGITLPNRASVALHERMGMVKVAEFPEVGYKQGRWLDVGYWQLILP